MKEKRANKTRVPTNLFVTWTDVTLNRTSLTKVQITPSDNTEKSMLHTQAGQPPAELEKHGPGTHPG